MTDNNWITANLSSKYNYLIDRDGTLIGTCKANFLAYSEAISMTGNFVNPKMYEAFHHGMSWRNLCELYYPDLESDIIFKIHIFKSQIFPKFLKETVPNVELIDFIKNVKWAVVTNATEKSSMQLFTFWGVLCKREMIFGAERKLLPKPSPELYLCALNELTLSSINTIAIEDSDHGEIAAQEAGLRVMRVPHIC